MAVSKIQTGLRISEETYSKLKTLSVKENRSLNNLVEYIIQKYLDDFEKVNGSIPLSDTQAD
ncbi:MAG: hypothetical protein HFG43_00795 [Lachnospiraceae bacterium]|jgi:predicted DNA-binding protein|nr:hypothetical protein [Lachnospiraceae bacterium]